MHAGGAYQLEAAVTHDQLAFRLTDKATGQSTASKAFPAPQHEDPTVVVVRVGEADVAQLNDARRLRAYGEAMGLVVARALGRAGGVAERARVVEWSGDFSALGLVALRCVAGDWDTEFGRRSPEGRKQGRIRSLGPHPFLMASNTGPPASAP
jgi:hypothetical protein